MIEAIALIKEKRAEWNELMTNKEKLTQDCLQFSPEQPEFEQFDQVQSSFFYSVSLKLLDVFFTMSDVHSLFKLVIFI